MNLPELQLQYKVRKKKFCNATGNIFSIPPVMNATSYIWNVTSGTIMGRSRTTLLLWTLLH
ncbi:MAG: hypothetical protein IPN36_15275 [Bacteroidetes bacterium]|nr:hypothetical protein [Bacteroidota bacterium]